MHRLRACLSLVPVFALMACASSAVPSVEMGAPTAVFDRAALEPSPSKGRIVVKRDGGGPLGPRNCSQLISVDGKRMLELGHAQGAVLYLEPGEHVVSMTFQTWVCNTGDSQVAVRVDAGQEKVVRSVVNANSIVTLQQSSP